jgi:hypothetical protein
MTLLRVLTLAACAFLLHADELTDNLLDAARKGDLATVKALLDRGADVNAKSPYGQTPLFFACDRGYVEIVKLLLDRGADVDIQDTFYHESALAWAAQKKRPEVVKLLLEHGAKSPANILMIGVQTNNAEFVKIALDVSKDKGGIDKPSLSSALTAAAGKPEIAALLTAAGAEPMKSILLDETILASYAGIYTGSIQGNDLEMTFTVKVPNLSGVLAGQPAVTYAPIDKTHFHSVEIPGVELEFSADAVRLKQNAVTIDFRRKGTPK